MAGLQSTADVINVVKENTYTELNELSDEELTLWIMECLSGE